MCGSATLLSERISTQLFQKIYIKGRVRYFQLRYTQWRNNLMQIGKFMIGDTRQPVMFHMVIIAVGKPHAEFTCHNRPGVRKNIGGFRIATYMFRQFNQCVNRYTYQEWDKPQFDEK